MTNEPREDPTAERRSGGGRVRIVIDIVLLVPGIRARGRAR